MASACSVVRFHTLPAPLALCLYPEITAFRAATPCPMQRLGTFTPFRALRISSCKHPQLLVLPFLRTDPGRVISLPQAHLHNHTLWPCLSYPEKRKTVSLPKTEADRSGKS